MTGAPFEAIWKYRIIYKNQTDKTISNNADFSVGISLHNTMYDVNCSFLPMFFF